LTEGEGNTVRDAKASHGTGPTESKTLSMRGHFMHENREIPCTPSANGWAGRPEKGRTRTSGVYVLWEVGQTHSTAEASEQGRANSSLAEEVEGRGLTKGNVIQ